MAEKQLENRPHVAGSRAPNAPEDAAIQRRKEPRFPAAERAIMRVLGPEGRGSLLVRIVDTSESGLGISSPVYVRPGAIVEVAVKHVTTSAEVRWCRQREEGAYRVGLQILVPDP